MRNAALGPAAPLRPAAHSLRIPGEKGVFEVSCAAGTMRARRVWAQRGRRGGSHETRNRIQPRRAHRAGRRSVRPERQLAGRIWGREPWRGLQWRCAERERERVRRRIDGERQRHRQRFRGSGGSAARGARARGAAGSSGGSGSGGGSTSSGSSSGAPSVGPWAGLKVSGTTFVDATGAEIILRGIGIGEMWNVESYMINVDSPDVKGMGESKLRDALVAGMGQAATDTFFSTWESNVVAASDVALWAGWGVNSIRLPVTYHMISSGDGAYIEAGFQKIDAFIALCRTQKIYVILDLHAAPGAQNCEQMSDSPDGVAHLWSQPTMYRQWTIDLWQTIAKRYATETAVGGFDIFDEPYDTESSGTFSSGDGTPGADVPRSHPSDPSGRPEPRPLLRGGPTGPPTTAARTVSRASSLLGTRRWPGRSTSTGTTTRPGPRSSPYLDLRTSSNRPVWNGETGEDTTSGWSGAMIKLLEANKIGWNEWTYKKVAQSENFYSIAQSRPPGARRSDLSCQLREQGLRDGALGPEHHDDGARGQRRDEQVRDPERVVEGDLQQVSLDDRRDASPPAKRASNRSLHVRRAPVSSPRAES